MEIAGGIKAVVWAVDIWKDVGGGRWDNYDLFYRIIDTTSGQFLTEEVRLTDDFSSDYIETLMPDQKGGFSIVWNTRIINIPLTLTSEHLRLALMCRVILRLVPLNSSQQMVSYYGIW